MDPRESFNQVRYFVGPVVVCIVVIIASLGKIIFHNYEWISATIPESVLLIILGIPIGLVVDGFEGHDGEIHLTSGMYVCMSHQPFGDQWGILVLGISLVCQEKSLWCSAERSFRCTAILK